MTVRVLFAPEAQAQVLESAVWWIRHRPAAPSLFQDALDDAIALLERNPEAGRLYVRRGGVTIRRFLLREVRFHVYYVYDERERLVTVRAVWNAVRGRAPRLGPAR